MFSKILRFIVSILLIPACVAVTMNFYKGIIGIKSVSGPSFLFIVGALAYSVTHLVLFKLNFLYVLGHELTHAIATFFSGGKIAGFKVSSKGGSVQTSTPNSFVMLAPYLIPGYTVFITIVYFGLSFFMNVSRCSNLFIFLVGFTTMFHLAYTAESIRDKQSDLIKTGYLFSISFIYIINMIIVFGIISLFFTEVDFFDFLSGSFESSKKFYYSFWRQLFL